MNELVKGISIFRTYREQNRQFSYLFGGLFKKDIK